MTVTLKTMVTGAASASMFALLAACGGGGDSDSSASERPAANAAAPMEAEEASDDTADMDGAADAMADDVDEMADDMEADAEEAADDMAAAAEEAGNEIEDAVEDAGDEMEETADAMMDEASDAIYASGDATAGKRVFTQCMACHAAQEGVNKVGPSLYGIVGREAGTVEGFNYSEANANSGITWTKDVLFEYLEAPQEYIPGTKMIFPGLKKPEDRANVIAYLAEQG